MNPLQPTAGSIDEGVHCLPVRVYWEDTDAGGIVYHANFIRYFERGRSDLLRLIGATASDMMSAKDDALVYVVRRLELDYLRPARLDDALIVHTALQRVRAAAVAVRQWVSREGAILAEGRLEVAAVTPEGRPRRWPAKVKEAFEELLRAEDGN